MYGFGIKLLMLMVLFSPWGTNAYAFFIPPPAKAEWTIMVYMAGDNDLEDYVVKDLEAELAAVGSTPQVQVVALADRSPGYDTSREDWSTTKLFHLTQGMLATPAAAVADWGERNTGNAQTLLEFVQWSKKHYPAKRYALYLWGHGWSWHPGYVMEDKTSEDALNFDELKGILPQLGTLDLVAYDGCNMAAIEVGALWLGHAKTLVHSQEYVDWDGIEYDWVLQQLKQNPQATPLELAVLTNQSASRNQERTGSAVALDQRFATLLRAVDQWALALMQGMPRYKTPYKQAIQKAQNFVEAPDEKDLYHLARLIEAGVPDPNIQAKSRAVMMALQASVIHEWHTKEYPNAHGISISVVSPQSEDDTVYRRTDFARLTHWDEFLAQNPF